jgi:hypothetical protein
MILLTNDGGVEFFGEVGVQQLTGLKSLLHAVKSFNSLNMRSAIWEPQYTPTLPGSQETGFLPAVSLSRNVTSARKGKLISVSETTNTRIAYLAGVAALQASTLCTSVATIFTTCFHVQYVIISPRMYSNIPFHSHKKQLLS